MIRYVQITLHNFTIQILVILPPKWKLPTEERKKQNTRCINVRWWTTEFCFSNNFWCHIAWCSAEHFYFLLIWDASGEAEVDQFDIALLVKHNVLQFDVSVSYTL